MRRCVFTRRKPLVRSRARHIVNVSLKSMRASHVCALVCWAACIAAESPPSADSTVPPALDVKAERARREAIRQAKQSNELERKKKAGEPFLVSYVEPKFPAGVAKEINMVAVAAVLHVDENGAIRGIRLESPSNPPFDWAVIEAVWKWRFSPQKVGGSGVPFDYRTTVYV